MTCPRLRHGPSEFDEGPPAHSEAGSSLTCAKHTFMWSTCQASKIRRLTPPGIPGLEKRETLRQAHGRLWGTPVFPLSTLKTSRVIARPRCRPPAGWTRGNHLAGMSRQATRANYRLDSQKGQADDVHK